MHIISSEARNLNPLQHMKISPVGRNDKISYYSPCMNSEFPQQEMTTVLYYNKTH